MPILRAPPAPKVAPSRATPEFQPGGRTPTGLFCDAIKQARVSRDIVHDAGQLAGPVALSYFPAQRSDITRTVRSYYRRALQLPNSQRMDIASPFTQVTEYASNPGPFATRMALGSWEQDCAFANRPA